MLKENEKLNKEEFIWFDSWKLAAQLKTCKSTEWATNFADECLNKFMNRFTDKERIIEIKLKKIENEKIK
jgi:hypothetical protein